MSLCKHCIVGKTHTGTPEGKVEQIAGVECYITTPTIDYAKDTVILFLADALGPFHINSKLLADDFARNGYKVVAPDYFAGNPIPVSAVLADYNLDSSFDLGAWVSQHPQSVVRPMLDKVVAALKEQGIIKFGTTGYCFGGRYVFDLAIDNVAHVSVASHPSLLKIPDDLEKYLASSQAPLLLNTCTVDGQFPPSAQATADELFGGGKFKPGYTREYWDGCVHGFAVRGDLNDKNVKKGMEGAFKAAVEWFGQYL
jgi:dienelactone hydrolase